MTTLSCGIDFGTSNSSIALASNQKITLVPVENLHETIPSAIFFSEPAEKPRYGRAAAAAFLAKKKGRYMRSLKRILGTSLSRQGTQINGKVIRFDRIISMFLQNLKDQATTLAKEDIEHVVIGRPVHFIDQNSEADQQAQEELRMIAQTIGFKHIEFQFEPIAAAFAHEVHIQGEKLALVVDLGGGTSDFTVIKLSDQYIHKQDRREDILASTGTRIGGNDFDKNLSLAAIMPHLGYKSTYGEKNLEVPVKLYHDLSEWSKINFLYTIKIISQVRQLLYSSHEQQKLSRLLRILEQETGHTLLTKVEEAKIALTAQAAYAASLDFVENHLLVNINRAQFEEAIRHEVEKIAHAATDCVRQAAVHNRQIELIILTGGSTEIPLIQQLVKRLFPQATLAEENKLSSVGVGLGYDSQRRFR